MNNLRWNRRENAAFD